MSISSLPFFFLEHYAARWTTSSSYLLVETVGNAILSDNITENC